MAGRLEGKVALITGASSGIGLASAERFSREGARVFMVGRRERELAAAAEQVGRRARAIVGDVGELDDLDRVFAIVKEDAGSVDILFANAGGGEFAALGAITEEHFDQTVRTNVKGTVFTVQKALPLLRDRSSVILTGSTAAVTGTPGFSVYSATKAAIRSLARCWVLDLAERGIRVNVLAPGATLTPGWRDLAASEEAHDEMVRFVRSTTPLGRLATPEEVAGVALFLASDDSSFMTGSEVFVDGGSAQI